LKILLQASLYKSTRYGPRADIQDNVCATRATRGGNKRLCWRSRVLYTLRGWRL
jgi:hypothetical protein